MLPIFGHYLLKNYLKIFLLSVLSFIAILLVSRLEEIAHVASMGAPFSYLARFTLYQIPYILPIAIPISCLISARVFFQHLSHTHELTALRVGGFSLQQIVSPILIAGAFLAIGTFYIASELATASHLATRKMIYDLTSENPILLLQSAKIAKLKGSYIQMDPIHNGRAAKDLLIALKNRSNGRLNLCLAKHVNMEQGNLKGQEVSLISSIPGPSTDHLILENQEIFTSSAPELAHLLRKKGWKVANDHLKFSLLRIREKMLRKEGGKKLAKCHSEIARRLSLGLATFTFTLMGLSFGIEMSRNRTKKGMICILFLTALTLIAFFFGKECDHIFWLAATFFLLPHLLIIITSIWTLSRINRGLE